MLLMLLGVAIPGGIVTGPVFGHVDLRLPTNSSGGQVGGEVMSYCAGAAGIHLKPLGSAGSRGDLSSVDAG